MNAFKYGALDWVIPYILLIGLAVVDVIGIIFVAFYFWIN